MAVDDGVALAIGREAPKAATVAAGLTAVTLVTLVSGLVTGPLLAQALGATGRGLLASVLVPLGVAPFVAQLGLGAWAVRAAARGVPAGAIVGTLAVPLLVVGAAVTAASGWIAALLLPEDPSARLCLHVGLALLPAALLTTILADLVWGQQRWRLVIATRLISPLGLLVVTPILFVTDALTVSTAAALVIALGFVPLPLLVALLPGARRPRPNRRLMGEALGFGLRAWPGTLADLANQRLDQLLMVPLLPPRELGLYAVATTVAVLGTAPAGAIASIVFPRVAQGRLDVLAPAFRTTAVILLVTQGLVALSSPVVVPVLFGESFREAVPLALILAPAWLLTALTPVLAHALAGCGYPAPGSAAQLVGLVVTVIGLAVSLPTLGATGAAITSLAASCVVLGYLLRSTVSHLGISQRELLVLRGADVATAYGAIRDALAAMRRRG